jgi:hypothetical protein
MCRVAGPAIGGVTVGLRDKLRALRPAGSTPPTGPAEPDDVDAAPAEAPAAVTGSSGAASPRDDVTDFSPRSDGDYHSTEPAVFLRFARPAVTESTARADEPAVGEFTSSGRWVVQRRFGRPVVYTVLEVRGESFTARRTDTATASTAELLFTFEPDGAAADG